MKSRKCFVSNSSSSSFIVIQESKTTNLKGAYRGKRIEIGDLGKRCFGWENELSCDVWSKINFCLIQAKDSALPDKYFRMIFSVIADHTSASAVTLKSGFFDNYFDAYIDHQSSSSEGQNMKMFDSEDTLTRFIFGEGSYIQTGNDNEW